MSDLDRLLRDSLKEAGDRYDPATSTASREGFVAFRKRRALTRGVASVAIVAVVIAAAAVAAPWPKSDAEGPTGPAGPPSALPGEMYVTQRIDVGDAPTDIEIGDTRVYVGHEGAGPIEAVDPSQQEVTELIGGSNYPEMTGVTSYAFVEVESGTAWTAGDGGLSMLDVEAELVSCDGMSHCRPSYRPASEESGLVTDLELTADSVWASGADDPHGGRYQVARFSRDLDLNDGFEPEQHLGFLGVPRIEYGYDALWVAQQLGDGGVFRVDPVTLEKERVEAADPDSSGGSPFLSMSDVSVGAGGIWAFGSSGGRSGDMSWRSTATRTPEGGPVRVDPETHKAGDHIVLPGVPGGDFGRVEASDDLGVFVMAKVDAQQSKLFRIDPASSEVIGEPLDFGPGPFALESGFRSLWIADQHEDVVYRVEIGVREEADPPAPRLKTTRTSTTKAKTLLCPKSDIKRVGKTYRVHCWVQKAIRKELKEAERLADRQREEELLTSSTELTEIMASSGQGKKGMNAMFRAFFEGLPDEIKRQFRDLREMLKSARSQR